MRRFFKTLICLFCVILVSSCTIEQKIHRTLLLKQSDEIIRVDDADPYYYITIRNKKTNRLIEKVVYKPYIR